jgi:hypothetical protein
MFLYKSREEPAVLPHIAQWEENDDDCRCLMSMSVPAEAHSYSVANVVKNKVRMRRRCKRVKSDGKARALALALPASAHRLLHPTRRHRWWRARHGHPSGRVNDGNWVASPSGGRLMQLQARLLALKRRRDKRRCRGVKGEG